MRSSSLVLLLLMGVQAVLNMGGGRALSTEAANHDIGQQTAANHRAGQQRREQTAVGDLLSTSPQEQHRTSHHRTRRPHRPPASQAPATGSVSQSLSPLDLPIPEVDPKVFSKRRFRSSPRVVFSDVPPSHDVPEGKDSESGGDGGGGGGARGSRVRRRVPEHRGEYSVCDSISHWVDNRTTATDIAGNEVTVLPNVRIENLVKRQFFYETTCLSPTHRGPGGSGNHSSGGGGGGGGGKGGGGGNKGGDKAGGRGRKQGSKSPDSGCRGIDVRFWNSYCTNTHTFVSAMTTFKKKTAWRNIRINVACVCVLTRKSWKGQSGR
ncbi:unnamed protein product [Merluccius merluccius]